MSKRLLNLQLAFQNGEGRERDLLLKFPAELLLLAVILKRKVFLRLFVPVLCKLSANLPLKNLAALRNWFLQAFLNGFTHPRDGE